MKKGVKVIAACLQEENVNHLRENGGENMLAVQMDVSSEDSIQEAYSSLINTHPQIQRGMFILPHLQLYDSKETFV